MRSAAAADPSYSLLLALFAALGIVHGSDLTVDDVVSYGLSLSKFNTVRNSESPFDFGGLSAVDTDQLWLDAAAFEYEVATSHASDDASSGYHPYLICSTFPDLSGSERQERVVEYFSNANVSASEYYAGGNDYHNSDEMSCGVVRAFDDTLVEVYAANPDAAEYMYSNPLHPSMKMTAGTLVTLGNYIARDAMSASKDMVSTSSSESESQTMAAQTLVLHMMLCPGVRDFAGGDVPADQVEASVKDFLTGTDTVKPSSFYYNRVESSVDGEEAVYTTRMSQWSEAISKVTNMTKDDGTNPCLDTFIAENHEFLVDGTLLDVRGKKSPYELKELGQTLGMTEDDIEACYLFMTYGLALNPQVCTLEPRTRVMTLCKDGTSDLSQCPAGTTSSGTLVEILWKVPCFVSLLGVLIW